MPTADHLGRQHPGKTRPALVEQNAVLQVAGQMNDAFERRRGGITLQGYEEVAHGVGRGHIHGGDRNGGALGAQVIQRFRLAGRGDALARGQHQMARALGHKPARHL